MAGSGETTPLLSGPDKTTTSRKAKQRCGVLREEFRCKNFTFQFHDEGVFYKSQWRWPRLVFVLFRLAVAIYIVTICILTLTYFPRKNPNRPWPVWLTNWSYLLLTIHELVAATIALLHSTDNSTGCCSRDTTGRDGDDSDDVRRDLRGKEKTRVPIPCYIRFDWFLFSVASTVAVQVTLMNVVGLIAKPEDAKFLNAKGINNHYINSLVVLLEFCIAALPVRLLHIVYVVAYYCFYYLFSVVFWSVDHTENVLYVGAIDWNYPAATVVNFAVTVFMFCCIQVILFGLYRFRLFVYGKIYGEQETEFEPIYGLL